MIFDVFDNVLSELNSSGEDVFGDEWHAKVAESIDGLSAYYGNQNLRNPNRQLVDYSGLPTQAAYVFMYAVGRADFTYQLLSRFREAYGKPLFNKPTLNVTSVGGGPASELVGLILYLEDGSNGENVSEVLYDVVDKEGDWNTVANLVIEAIQTDIEITPNFKEVDLAAAGSGAVISVEFDDLVIMSFFISEICELPNPKNVRFNIDELLRSMKKGAKLLYNDSDAYSFYMYMNNRARSIKGLQEISEIQDVISMDYSSPSDTYQSYSEMFDKVPHLSSKAVAKLFERTLP